MFKEIEFLPGDTDRGAAATRDEMAEMYPKIIVFYFNDLHIFITRYLSINCVIMIPQMGYQMPLKITKLMIKVSRFRLLDTKLAT
jgi:hypothetical protein